MLPYLALLALNSTGAEPLLAFTNARILTAEGPAIERGTLLIQGKKILEVGPAGSVATTNARVIDMEGKTLVPGFVDTHSHIGGGSGGDQSGPIQTEARIQDAIDPRDPAFVRALAGGITTVNVMPGSGHLSSGQTIYLKLRRKPTLEGLAIAGPAGPLGGLKMANGTNPIGDPPFPGTRAKSMALVREHFLKAQAYRLKLDAYARDKAAGKEVTEPERDLALEPVVEVLRGTRIVHHHTHRADDILSVLRLQREFGFRVVLHHVSEAWKVAKEIAAAKADCSIIALDAPGGKLEAADFDNRNGHDLTAAGARIAYHTDNGITESRLFLRSAALSIRAGLDPETALLSLTLNGAAMLGLENQVGSLAKGKDADFVVLDRRDPFSIYTKVLQTWVEGQKVFDRSDAKDRLIATGGYGATRGSSMYLCCAEDQR